MRLIPATSANHRATNHRARATDRTTTRLATSTMWAVRRDWPGGDHEFLGADPRRDRAERALRADESYWRRGPMRPRLSLVEISPHDFRLHARARRGCRAPDCPSPG